MTEPPVILLAARPVWLHAAGDEMNVMAGFQAVFDAPADPAPAEPTPVPMLRIAACSTYKAWLNGAFLGYGPARAAHGWFHVDRWPLAPLLRPGANLLAIEVLCHRVNSYDTLDQPGFLLAEVTAGTRVLAATGAESAPFHAGPIDSHLRRVARYSFQRGFTEAYRQPPGAPDLNGWKQHPVFTALPVPAPAGQLLPRAAPRPCFDISRPERLVAHGGLQPLDPPPPIRRDRHITRIGPHFKGFPESTLETAPWAELQRQRTALTAVDIACPEIVAVGAGRTAILDFGRNDTGFLMASVTCDAPATLWLAFDEILTEGDVDFLRLDCLNLVSWELQPGTHRLETAQPYTLRYLKLICMAGHCEIGAIGLRQYVHPPVAARFAASDARLDTLFAAGIATYRQNAVDLFMDCPSRERAGWLCDSFFMGRVERDLTGASRIERGFLMNFLRPAGFAGLPDGMLPMCYPADHPNGVFIPNWALWFVLQLEEYVARSGDRPLAAMARDRVDRLFAWFAPFENADGLLEKLPGWVFVEWSDANKYVQDVSYPTNMLYAAALAAAARLYGVAALAAKAAAIRETIRRQSFDGTFFVDNALRRDGVLAPTRNRTEVCQYYAFYFDIATPETHPALWHVLLADFGPARPAAARHPEIGAANAFIGYYLRLEILSRAGLARQALGEATGYFLHMAERTGTLWEHDGPRASCDHGFAAHVIRLLYRDALGLAHIDTARRVVAFAPPETGLDWCEGTLPVADGAITARWWRDGDTLRHAITLPPGWRSAPPPRSTA